MKGWAGEGNKEEGEVGLPDQRWWGALPSCVAVTLPGPVVLGAVEGGGASAVATRGGAEGIECVDLSLLPPRPPAIASRWPDLMER